MRNPGGNVPIDSGGGAIYSAGMRQDRTPAPPRPAARHRGFRRLALAAIGALAAIAAPARADAPAAAASTPAPTPPAAPAPAPAPAPDIAHPALWKLSAGGSTIWLMGTLHALPRNVVWFRGPVAAAFDASGDLVTEIVEKSPADMREILAAKAMLPAGQSLTALIAPRDRARFARALAANGLPPGALDRFQPWYAAVALSTLPLMHGGYDPAAGVDATLTAKATPPGHTHEALETPEYQLGLFASLPMATQLAYLREVVRGLPTINRELGGMIAAWKAGRADRLARIMNSDQDSPEMRKLLLIDRNKAWARWIAGRVAHPHAAGEVLFVAVGAGHLAGPGSLLDQLAAAGLHAVRVQ